MDFRSQHGLRKRVIARYCLATYTSNMETRDLVHLHECCVVPYRVSALGVELCLTTPTSENRWEFPKISVDASGEDAPWTDEAVRAAEATGLHGNVAGPTPLGHFTARRGSEARSMTGFLMQVTKVDDAWPRQSSHKRLWCLPEEARVRIRRKPLRQFIDEALHAVDAARRTHVNGNGSSNRNGAKLNGSG